MDSTIDALPRVLRELQADGRESYTRIADRLGMSRRQVTQIVQEAIERGEVHITASVSPDLLGVECLAYLQISVDGPVAPLREALVAMPETSFVSETSGATPLDAELRVGADPHLRATMDRIRALPGVREIQAHLYESIEVNLYSPLRTGRTTFDVDAADLSIVRALRDDGRASFLELGQAAGISPSGARLRLRRLIAQGALKVVGIPLRGKRSGPAPIGIGLSIRGPLDVPLARVRALEPEFLSVTVGEFDMIAMVTADNTADLLAWMEEVRSIPGVVNTSSWSHLRIAKEQYGHGHSLEPFTPVGKGAAIWGENPSHDER